MNISNKAGLSVTDNSVCIMTNDVEETIRLGSLIGQLLKAGDVVALMGQLGAGKTHMVKGMADGLGVEDGRRVVTSPSYVLVKQYMGRVPVYHFDAYRLESSDEMNDIDCISFFWGDGVSIVEWADKVMECLPDEHIKIVIEMANQTSRDVRLSHKGERYKGFMKELNENVIAQFTEGHTTQ